MSYSVQGVGADGYSGDDSGYDGFSALGVSRENILARYDGPWLLTTERPGYVYHRRAATFLKAYGMVTAPKREGLVLAIFWSPWPNHQIGVGYSVLEWEAAAIPRKLWCSWRSVPTKSGYGWKEEVPCPTDVSARAMAKRFPALGAVEPSGIRATFSASQVWADAQLGGSIGSAQRGYQQAGCLPGGQAAPGASEVQIAVCSGAWREIGRINAAGMRAAKAIQAGLNELGYGPVTVGEPWGVPSSSSEAWAKFTADAGVPAGPGLVSRDGIFAMEAALKGGKTPGPTKAGLGPMGWLLIALGLGAAGIAAVAGKKRSKAATGRMVVRR